MRALRRWLSDPLAPGRARNWALAFLAVGSLDRTVRWALGFPFWGDESAVALNLVGRDFAGVLEPLEHAQVAPVGFVLGEVALYRWLGPSEQALRLLPYLASLASLLCVWRLGRAVETAVPTLPGGGALLGLAIFSVSHYLVRYGSELKPYAGDALVAALLAWLAIGWLRASASGERDAARWLWLLALAAAPAMGISYPSVFIAAGIGLALLPRLWRLGPGATWLAFAAFGLATLVGFVGSHVLVGGAQREAASLGTNYLDEFWAKAFPPAAPLALLVWLLQAHTGLMFAYPNGGRSGGSSLTLLFFLVGAWTLVRPATAPAREPVPSERAGRGEPRGAIAGVLLLPFPLGLVAAALRFYPYGGHLRLTLYLAPAICLLAGIGLARVIDAARTPAARTAWRAAVVASLLAVGLGEVIADVAKPFRTERQAAMRTVVARAVAQAGARDQLVSLHALDEVRASKALGSNFEWYLRSLGRDRASWGGQLDSSRLAPGSGVVALLYATRQTLTDGSRLDAWLAQLGGRLRVASETTECFSVDCAEALRVFRLEPAAGATLPSITGRGAAADT